MGCLVEEPKARKGMELGDLERSKFGSLEVEPTGQYVPLLVGAGHVELREPPRCWDWP